MLAALLSLLLTSSLWAKGDSLAVPFHVPPSLVAEPDSSGLELSGGWMQFRGAGIGLSGAGGGWEWSNSGEEGWGAAVRGHGFALSGAVQPAVGGRLKTSGFTGSLEGDAVYTSGYWRAYAGGVVNVSGLDLFDTRRVEGFVEPDGAYSIVVGVPVGAELHGELGAGWSARATGFVVPWLGGATGFTYFLPGRQLYGSSKHVHAHLSAGGRVRIESPYRLAVEAGGSAASASGNSRALSVFYILGSWRVF